MNPRHWCITFLAPTLLALGCADVDDAGPMDVEASQEMSTEAPVASSAVFSGTVRNEQGVAQAGAQVIINGIARTTDATGRYFVSVVASSNGYVVSIKKNGFASLSEFYSAGKTSLSHTLQTGYVAAINPAVDNTVTTPSGVQVVLKANTLVTASGSPATGTVNVTVASYDPLRMPGDFTAVNSTGEQVALESVGAVFIGAADSSGQALNLKAGATADGFIPLPTQLGSMPPCVFDGSCRLAMWKFNEITGKWEEKSANMQVSAAGTSFTMLGASTTGSQAVPITPGGLGSWNADIEKRQPACTIVELVGFPAECFNPGGTVKLNLKLPNTAGTLVSRVDSMGATTPFIVLYNIRPNVVQEVGLSFPIGAPAACAKNLTISSDPAPVAGFPVYSPSIGITRFNSGAPWGGIGFPRDSGNQLIDFEDVALGNDPCKSHVWFQTSL